MKALIAQKRWIENPLKGQNESEKKILLLFNKESENFAHELASFGISYELRMIDQEDSIKAASQLCSEKKIDTLYFVSCQKSNFSDQPNRASLTLLRLVQVLKDILNITLKVIITHAIKFDEDSPLYHPLDASLIGLTQGIGKEFPHWKVALIHVEKFDAITKKMIHAENCSDNENGDPIYLKEGKRYIRSLEEIEIHPKNHEGFKQNGKYLIVGGAKGIGFETAKHIAKNYSGELFLIGRSEVDEGKLNQLRDLGGNPTYIQADITNLNFLKSKLGSIYQLDGVIHSGIILEDRTIRNMSEETFLRVVAPKVEGSINLFLATRHCSPSLFLFYSSFQSYLANPGQANYSSASTFQDSWSDFLRDTYMIDARVINWSFWGSVGIVASPEYRDRMEKLEIGSIEPIEGISIVESFLKSDLGQIAVIKASNKATERLGVTRKKNIPKKFEEIVPKLDLKNSRVTRNLELQKALENYSRWAIHQVKMPEQVIEKYQRLKNSLKKIPSHKPFNPETFLKDYPELKGHVALLKRCIDHYPKVLKGEIDHMQVLFPNGSFDLVTPIYQNNPIADYFNDVVADIVEGFASLKEEEPLEIIEIGAGTGSTTEKVLPRLDSRTSHYLFTDISLGFTRIAREKWKEVYPFVDYQTVDIGKEQQLGKRFDILIATNVLHATSNIEETMKHVSQLVKPGGMVVINEVTERQDFATITFGLTTGWWLYKDHRIPHSPLIAGETWEKLLKDNHFSEIRHHGSNLQQIIVGLYQGESVHNHLESPKKSLKSHEMENYLKGVIGQVMKIEPSTLDSALPLSEYGIDSLIVLEILKPLSEKFGYLPSTLIFEHPTIEKLAKYLDSKNLKENLKVAISQTPKNDPFSFQVKNNDLENDLKEIICKTMKIPVEEFDTTKNFAEYGIDSLIVLEILKPLQEKFGYLPSTLLFEYPNLKLLTGYFSSKSSIEKQAGKFEDIAEDWVVDDSDIAIIGMSGKFPKADSIDQFWLLLKNGKDGFGTIPRERWDWRAFSDLSGDDPTLAYVHKGGFIDKVEYFDYQFFNITPFDAEKIDPQERLFLQSCYHTIEDAGYTRENLPKKTGVFVGVMNGGYGWLGVSSEETNDADSLYWSIANRVSYVFDFSGPSLAVDTACSSSLSALHLAIGALKNRDCECALVGGVNLILHPKQLTKLSRLHMVSKKEVASPFSSEADGFIDGEAIISILIKPLKSALKDKDRIYGVVKGSAINSGGKTSGYTVPNPAAQGEVISEAIARSKIDPETITYVEAHGTGTELGDPIELRGLSIGFNTQKTGYCKIGSVKSNIGHTESAAGLSGLVKVLLQMKHQQFVPSLNCDPLNPRLDIDKTPFLIQKQFEPWEIPTSIPSRRASLSSFGAGGANAHIILEESRPRSLSLPKLPLYLLPLSGKTSLALQKKINDLRKFLARETPDEYQLCYTLGCCRTHFSHRVAYVFQDIEELRALLNKDLTEFANDSTRNKQIDYSIFLSETDLTKKRAIGEEISLCYRFGDDIDWSQLYPERSVLSCSLYPFEENFCWIKNPFAGLSHQKRYEQHHIIGGTAIIPASMTFSILDQQIYAPYVLEDLAWIKPIMHLDEISIDREGQRFVLKEREKPTSIFAQAQKTDFTFPTNSIFIEEEQWDEIKEKEEIYRDFEKLGYQYHHTYQRLQWVKIGKNWMKGAIELDLASPFSLDPALIDAAMQLAIMLRPVQKVDYEKEIFVPFTLKKFYRQSADIPQLVFSTLRVKAVNQSAGTIRYDILITDENSSPLIIMEDLTSKLIERGRFRPEPKDEPFMTVGELQFL